MASPFEAELEGVIAEYKSAMSRSQYNDGSDILKGAFGAKLETSCLAAIERAAGRNSIYFANAQQEARTAGYASVRITAYAGIAEALLNNIRAGYLTTLEELVHGELFADFLEMAQHLLETGYKDAAAVIAGSTLESHLKQLCKKAGLPTDVGGKPKKADTINSELASAGVISKLDQKSVTAWLGLRNSAAHGDFGAYDSARVGLLIEGIRNLVARVPA